MGLFRAAMGLFRGGTAKEPVKAATGLLEEQARTVPAEPVAAPVPAQPVAAPVPAQSVAARREVKREARPDPNKPGWGLTIGEEVIKARSDRASQE